MYFSAESDGDALLSVISLKIGLIDKIEVNAFGEYISLSRMKDNFDILTHFITNYDYFIILAVSIVTILIFTYVNKHKNLKEIIFSQRNYKRQKNKYRRSQDLIESSLRKIDQILQENK